MNLQITEMQWSEEDEKVSIFYNNGGQDDLTLEYVLDRKTEGKLNKAFNKQEVPCVYDDGIYLNYLFVYKSHLYFASIDDTGIAMWWKVVKIVNVKSQSVCADCVEQVN